jgi:LmbE family N-acetylglucosaminyl deacetylase
MMKTMNQKENIIFLCAHNDDHIIGGGGTIMKYLKQGHIVDILVFSYGEGSHPHFRRTVTVEMRVKESQHAARILGGHEISYLAMKEGRFADEFNKRRLSKRLQKYILSRNPSKIFTHSPDDPHPDHQATYRIVTGLLEKIRFSNDLYCFDVWNPFSITTRCLPKLVVDITDEFGTKIRSMEAHKSQKLAKLSLSWQLYANAFINGLKYGFRYAEVFYKLK